MDRGQSSLRRRRCWCRERREGEGVAARLVELRSSCGACSSSKRVQTKGKGSDRIRSGYRRPLIRKEHYRYYYREWVRMHQGDKTDRVQDRTGQDRRLSRRARSRGEGARFCLSRSNARQGLLAAGLWLLAAALPIPAAVCRRKTLLLPRPMKPMRESLASRPASCIVRPPNSPLGVCFERLTLRRLRYQMNPHPAILLPGTVLRYHQTRLSYHQPA